MVMVWCGGVVLCDGDGVLLVVLVWCGVVVVWCCGRAVVLTCILKLEVREDTVWCSGVVATMLATLVMVVRGMVAIMVRVDSSAVETSMINNMVIVISKVARSTSTLLSKMWCNSVW